MICIRQAEDVPGIFDERMLKSTAGSEKRTIALPREPDRVQGSVHACVRTARHAPYSVISVEFLGRIVFEAAGRCPGKVNAAAKFIRGPIQCLRDRGVRFHTGAEISD